MTLKFGSKKKSHGPKLGNGVDEAAIRSIIRLWRRRSCELLRCIVEAHFFQKFFLPVRYYVLFLSRFRDNWAWPIIQNRLVTTLKLTKQTKHRLENMTLLWHHLSYLMRSYFSYVRLFGPFFSSYVIFVPFEPLRGFVFGHFMFTTKFKQGYMFIYSIFIFCFELCNHI